MRSRLFPFALVLLITCAPAAFAQQQTSDDTFKDPTARVFQLVLPNEHLFGEGAVCERSLKNRALHRG